MLGKCFRGCVCVSYSNLSMNHACDQKPSRSHKLFKVSVFTTLYEENFCYFPEFHQQCGLHKVREAAVAENQSGLKGISEVISKSTFMRPLLMLLLLTRSLSYRSVQNKTSNALLIKDKKKTFLVNFRAFGNALAVFFFRCHTSKLFHTYELNTIHYQLHISTVWAKSLHNRL